LKWTINAKRFAIALRAKLASLPSQPYKYRQLKSFDDKLMRDFIFKCDIREQAAKKYQSIVATDMLKAVVSEN